MAQPGEKPPDPYGIIIVPVLVIAIAFALWYFNRTWIYYGAARMASWMLQPADAIGFVHQYRVGIARDVYHRPSALVAIGWINAAWRVPAAAFLGWCLWLAHRRWSHPIVRMKGPMTVDALLANQARVFSAIAPIVPISREMHLNKDPRWHESYQPQEVVVKFGLAQTNADDEANAVDGEDTADDEDEDEGELFMMPVAASSTREAASKSYPSLNRERVENYFLKQLGRRIYHPGIDYPFDADADHTRPGSCFPDKFNNYEKAIFALFAPLALKGPKGLDEYYELRDALNRSAVNATQTPTLSLANGLYTKYRADPKINLLFERHHFAVTYLMQLFTLAKRAGRVTNVEVLGWLRPNQNNLFWALETVGRKVAFTESGGSYCQWLFELHCNKRKRTPLIPCVAPAVLSLEQEWAVWNEATHRETEESIWGRMRNGADGLSIDHEIFSRHVRDVMYAQMSAPPPVEGEETIFDKTEGGDRQAEALRRKNDEDDRLRKLMNGGK